jgi:hypothetical protein
VVKRGNTLRPLSKSRRQPSRSSVAATKADAAERERIRRMTAVDRALLALDLGERLSVFAKLRV